MFKYSLLAATVAASLNTDTVSKFAEGSSSRELLKINGNMVAAFTPVDKDGNLSFVNLEKMAARLEEWGIDRVMVGGTTGESVSFTREERLTCVKEWMKIKDKYHLKVYVHVGMNSLQEAAMLAADVAKLGIDGFLAMPPTYFRPGTPELLVDAMSVVANAAPDLPFWYYHFPDMTKVDMNMFSFVKAVEQSGKMPNFMGVKFTNEKLMEFNEIGSFMNNKYNMLIGRDEIAVSALATGVCDGAVGSTLNFISFNAPLKELYEQYNKEALM